MAHIKQRDERTDAAAGSVKKNTQNSFASSHKETGVVRSPFVITFVKMNPISPKTFFFLDRIMTYSNFLCVRLIGRSFKNCLYTYSICNKYKKKKKKNIESWCHVCGRRP